MVEHEPFTAAVQLLSHGLHAVDDESFDLVHGSFGSLGHPIPRAGQPLAADGLIEATQAEILLGSDSGPDDGRQVVDLLRKALHGE